MTILDIARKKAAGEKLVMATCYDWGFASLLAKSSVDMLLVGDSVAMVVHGHRNTLPADLAMMTLHTAAVARGAGEKFIVADMPYLAHRRGLSEAVEAAAALTRAGAHAVKLEGAAGNAETVRHLVESGVPVMGHIGLTPQFFNAIGGFRVQGRTEEAALALVSDALLLERAGCFSLVVEGVPAAVGRRLTDELAIPTIGIGAGPDTDGQVLVLHDLLGMTPRPPKFARAFAGVGQVAISAADAYAAAVRDGSFPGESESYS